MVGGPRTSGGSPGGSIDVSQPLVMVLKQVEDETSIPSDELEALVDGVMEQVLSMPPRQRFEESASIVEAAIRTEFGDIDVFAATLGPEAKMFLRVLDKILEYWLDQLVEQALEADGEEQLGHLVLVSTVALLQDIFDVLTEDESLTEAQREKVYSALVALYARVYDEFKLNRERDVLDLAAIARDTVRGEEALHSVLQPDVRREQIDLDDANEREIVWRVRDVGAAIAYEESEISLSRGGELASLTQDEFLELLDREGIEPRFGPESTESLWSDPDL